MIHTNVCICRLLSYWLGHSTSMRVVARGPQGYVRTNHLTAINNLYSYLNEGVRHGVAETVFYYINKNTRPGHKWPNPQATLPPHHVKQYRIKRKASINQLISQHLNFKPLTQVISKQQYTTLLHCTRSSRLRNSTKHRSPVTISFQPAHVLSPVTLTTHNTIRLSI